MKIIFNPPTQDRKDDEEAPVILSQTAVYAVKATLHLAEAPPDEPVRVEDIARTLAVPRNYLAKILGALGHAGILQSSRGRSGGFSLGRPSAEVTLADVIAPFDDIGTTSACLLGAARCSDGAPCAAHAHWREISATVRAFLDETTVEDLTHGGPSLEPATTPSETP